MSAFPKAAISPLSAECPLSDMATGQPDIIRVEEYMTCRAFFLASAVLASALALAAPAWAAPAKMKTIPAPAGEDVMGRYFTLGVRGNL